MKNAIQNSKEKGTVTLVTEFIPSNSDSSHREEAKEYLYMFEQDDASLTSKEESESFQAQIARKIEAKFRLESVYTSHSKQDKLVFSVIDTGEGINNSQLIKVFSTLARIKGKSMNESEVGMGLTIVKKIVNMFEG